MPTKNDCDCTRNQSCHMQCRCACHRVDEAKGVENMTIDELKRLKVQRYRDAQEDGSIAACYRVGRVLGKLQPAKYGSKYLWESAGVRIFVDDYGNYMTVHADGKQVCSTHTCDEIFIPGAWMEAVRPAALSATAKEQQDEARREEAARQALLRRIQ